MAFDIQLLQTILIKSYKESDDFIKTTSLLISIVDKFKLKVDGINFTKIKSYLEKALDNRKRFLLMN